MTILKIIRKLKECYPQADCTLNYNNPLELLVAIRLSAQCTDARVNIVTPSLFSQFKTIKDFATANPQDIAKHMYSCGFYKVKSKDIVSMCQKILSDFNGKIPENLEHLMSLPGIGRKSANLFLGEVFKIPSLVVDTHFIRLTKRLGLHNSKDPEKIEKIMAKVIPPEEMLAFSHRLVAHGRAICIARCPNCDKCCLKSDCKMII